MVFFYKNIAKGFHFFNKKNYNEKNYFLLKTKYCENKINYQNNFKLVKFSCQRCSMLNVNMLIYNMLIWYVKRMRRDFELNFLFSRVLKEFNFPERSEGCIELHYFNILEYSFSQ